MKRLSLAKSRLAAYGGPARESLALAFAADVVQVAREVGQVLVVTDDQQAAATLAALGAQIAPDDPDAGLNPALVHGADLLRARDPLLGVATLSADLPALRVDELRAALAQVTAGQRGFVPDVAGTGTTLLAAGPGAALEPRFGNLSCQAHLLSGATQLPAGPGLRHDVDTPEDLEAALRLGVGPHTSQAAGALR